jgi:hypothetical protein
MFNHEQDELNLALLQEMFEILADKFIESLGVNLNDTDTELLITLIEALELV